MTRRAEASERRERSIKRAIYRHQMHTSGIYAQMATAPDFIQEQFLDSLPNILVRRYAEKRIKDAAMDIALARIDEIDPYPFEHEGCPASGARSAEPEGDHAVFQPRDGFITDRSRYDV